MKIPNLNDTRDAAENLYDSMLKTANKMNADEIVERYNNDQVHRVAELEEKIRQLRIEIAMKKAAIKLIDPEYRPQVPILPSSTLYEPGYCDGCPYKR